MRVTQRARVRASADNSQMSKSRSGPAVDRIKVIQRTSPLPHSEAFMVTGTNVKAASDPSGQQLEERKRELIEEFVKAHGIQ